MPDSCEDCNGNGWVDSEDIQLGFSEDCNSDGIPDECNFGLPLLPQTYAFDDGTVVSNLNIVGATQLVWMNRFIVAEDAEWITAVQLVWGNTFPGQPGKVAVWSDPNGDGSPEDARLIRSFNTTSRNVVFGEFTTVEIPPTFVGPVGTSFFVGAFMINDFGTAPIALGTEDPDGESWWAASTDQDIDLDNLNDTSYIASWTAHDFLIRGVASDGSFENDCNLNNALDQCDILNGTSQDTDQNNIPDECDSPCPADLNQDRIVDGADLTILLSEWEFSDSIADLNGDSTVNGADLTILLSAWGTCTK